MNKEARRAPPTNAVSVRTAWNRTVRWGLAALLAWTLATCGALARSPDQDAGQLFSWFVASCQKLPVPAFNMSYVSNFRDMPAHAALERQATFFEGARARFRRIRRADLSAEVRYEYDALSYALDVERARVDLERRFRRKGSPRVPPGGLHDLPDAPQWYQYYVQRMGLNITSPDQLLSLGQDDMERAIREIRSIQREVGYEGRDVEFQRLLDSPKFVMTREKDVVKAFGALRATVQAHLAAAFEPVEIPPVNIGPWPHASKDSAPAYYESSNRTFYYTFHAGRFPQRSLEFLTLHEAVPGHHYQHQVAARERKLRFFRRIFGSPGFVEGWGTYAEGLGTDLGCFRDPYQRLGRWEWDLARCARVMLDVRIHHEGWTRAQAIAWWHAHVLFLDAIAEREVDRVIRWPAQSLCYKVGERGILALRDRARAHEAKQFDLRRFHAAVLRHGAVPLTVLDEVMADAIAGGGTRRR